MKPELGIAHKNRDKIIERLCKTLADTVVLNTKTRNAHWNVTGPHFNHLHKLFEAQYADLAESIDEIAERIRALGAVAPGSLEEFSKLARLKEIKGREEDGKFWISALLADHEAVVRGLREDVDETDKLGDAATSDFLTGLMEAHEKTAWMLRASL